MRVVIPSAEIVVRMVEGASISGQLVDASTGLEVEGSTELGDSRGGRQSRGGTPATEFEYPGLSPGTYYLVAKTPDGRVGVLRALDLRPGESITNLTVEVVPAGTLRMSYAGAEIGIFLCARSGDALLFSQSPKPDEKFEVPSPAGEVIVEVCRYDWNSPTRKYEVLSTRTLQLLADEVLDVVMQ